MAHLIEFRDVSKVYAQGRDPVRAVDGVSLSIDAGEFVAIMGASGSGKSTMLNILGCLDTPTGNLDTKSSVEVMELFTELSHEDVTIVMVTHEDDIVAYAKRHLVMKDGRLV